CAEIRGVVIVQGDRHHQGGDRRFDGRHVFSFEWGFRGSRCVERVPASARDEHGRMRRGGWGSCHSRTSVSASPAACRTSAGRTTRRRSGGAALRGGTARTGRCTGRGGVAAGAAPSGTARGRSGGRDDPRARGGAVRRDGGSGGP